MIRVSIKRKIIAIALILIVLMTAAALLSMALVVQVSARLEDLTQSYVPAYAALARANIHSLTRGVMLRRLVIEKDQSPVDAAQVAALTKNFRAEGDAVDTELKSARQLIDGLIEKGSRFGDTARLLRLGNHLSDFIDGTRGRLNDEIARLLPLLDAGDEKAIADGLERVDTLRDELDRQLDTVRTEMIDLLKADAAATARKQRIVLLVAILLTALAAALGLVFSVIVSTGLTRPVRRLLEGARAVEAGKLDETLAVTSQDEIGHLTVAFNSMVEQLRVKERIRETFGRYVDPRIVEGLISGPALAAEGQRRVMTVMFCDVKGFVGVSEEMTPQGLVKVMNRYFSTMSEPIHQHGGIIDKYIGDAIMAYWGPPFTEIADEARCACLAALDMLERVAVVSRGVAGHRRAAQRADFDRRPHGHRDRRGAGRQRRLRRDDELHRHGRDGKSGVASGRRQQIVRHPHPVAGSDRPGGRRCDRNPRDRSRLPARPGPLAIGIRDHGPRRRPVAGTERTADPLCRRSCGVSGAALGGGAACVWRGARRGRR